MGTKVLAPKPPFAAVGDMMVLPKQLVARQRPVLALAAGIERIVLGLKQQEIVEPPDAVEPQVLVAHFGGETKEAAVELAYRLRAAGIGARLTFARNKRSMKSQMREGNRHNVRYMLDYRESELEAGADDGTADGGWRPNQSFQQGTLSTGWPSSRSMDFIGILHQTRIPGAEPLSIEIAHWLEERGIRTWTGSTGMTTRLMVMRQISIS